MFNNMTVVELKEYLYDRGVSVNGYLKPASVEIVIAVEKMMLPFDPNFGKDQNWDSLVLVNDMEISDPFTSAHKLINNFADSPPFGLYDIFNYLINHLSDYDKQGLAVYKPFDEYRPFQDSYVESLSTETMVNERVHLYMAKVKQAMKEKTG
jgi:hypothetical protein